MLYKYQVIYKMASAKNINTSETLTETKYMGEFVTIGYYFYIIRQLITIWRQIFIV